MVRAILTIISALVGYLPKLIEQTREWNAENAANRERESKNARNAAAIAEAQKALDKKEHAP